MKEQAERLQALYRACVATRHELLLEVIPRKGSAVDSTTVARSLERIYDLGVFPDWWKLPPPDGAGWDAIEAVIDARDPHCRGVLLLGLEAPLAQLERDFAAAAGRRFAKGFAVGRSVFGAPAGAWFAGEIDDAEAVARMASAQRQLIETWRRAQGATRS